MKTINLIIPAAGNSTRFESSIPKQFHVVNGKTILEHSLLAFSDITLESCVIAASKESIEKVKDIVTKIPFSVKVVLGGKTRAESVREAFFATKQADITLIHDAARLCVSKQLINQIIQACDEYDAVIPAIPVTDTIKKVEQDRVIQTLSRSDLVAVQTPQGFTSNVLRKAYEACFSDTITDEASLIEHAGIPVHIIKGETHNIKVTNPIDLEYVRRYLSNN